MRLRIQLLALIMLLTTARVQACASADTNGDYVILLHGAGKTPLSMLPMEIYLREHGYRVINLRLHPIGRSLEQISESSLPPALKDLDSHAKIHFVTHSMGGIILRQYLARHNVPNLGRVVMLGPPNHGSRFVDWAKPNPLLRFIIGPRVLELGTGFDDLPTSLDPVHFECGVIAGDLCINPLSPFIFHEPNDGKVAVESARVPGMRDFLVVHIPHTWLIWQNKVFRQTAHFLASGEFDHKASPPHIKSHDGRASSRT